MNEPETIAEQPATDAPVSAPESAPVGEAPPPARRRTGFREYLESLLVTVLLALFGTTFIVQAFKIPTPSMEPTLLVGDHLLVNKFVFSPTASGAERALLPVRDVRRGDVVVFKYPEGIDRTPPPTAGGRTPARRRGFFLPAL